MSRSEPITLYQGKYLQLLRTDTWEFVKRRNVNGVVAILAVTPEKKLILVEQFRNAVNCYVIELPAGLSGDLQDSRDEDLAIAAQRELVEETGYDAARFERLAEGPSSAGMTDETVVLFRAHDLKRVSDGGGDASESIVIHEIPLATVGKWLRERSREGRLIDYRVFAGLWFLDQEDWS